MFKVRNDALFIKGKSQSAEMLLRQIWILGKALKKKRSPTHPLLCEDCLKKYGRKIHLVPVEFSAKPGVTARCPSCWREYSIEEQIQMAFRLHLDTPDY